MRILSAWGFVLLSPAILAQTPITLRDGNVTYDYNTYPTSPTDLAGYCNFTAGTLDHAYQNTWYYAFAGDTRGAAFNSSGGQLTANLAADGKSSELVWLNVDGRSISAVLSNTVYSTGSNTGISTQEMTVTNNTGAPLTIHIYAYLDLDINNTSGGDSAQAEPSLPNGNHFATDVVSLWYTALGFSNWGVNAYPSLRSSILNGSGGAPWIPGNAGTPFGPGDYTAVYHWMATIGPGASQSFQTMISDGLLPPTQRIARASTFCTAKPGTNGIPAWAVTRPFVGSTATLRVDNGLTGSAPIVFLGTSPAVIPFPPLGTVCTLPVTTFSMPAFDGSRTSVVNLPIPAQRSLGGAQMHFQALFADPGAVASLAHTDGLSWTLGNYYGN
jgi:hypothetical protein